MICPCMPAADRSPSVDCCLRDWALQATGGKEASAAPIDLGMGEAKLGGIAGSFLRKAMVLR